MKSASEIERAWVRKPVVVLLAVVAYPVFWCWTAELIVQETWEALTRGCWKDDMRREFHDLRAVMRGAWYGQQ